MHELCQDLLQRDFRVSRKCDLAHVISFHGYSHISQGEGQPLGRGNFQIQRRETLTPPTRTWRKYESRSSRQLNSGIRAADVSEERGYFFTRIRWITSLRGRHAERGYGSCGLGERKGEHAHPEDAPCAGRVAGRGGTGGGGTLTSPRVIQLGGGGDLIKF